MQLSSIPPTPNAWLKELLASSGCSQADLGRKIGKGREQITRWVSGREQIPRPYLVEIASSIGSERDVDHVLRLKDAEDCRDGLQRQAKRFAKLAHVEAEDAVSAMLLAMDRSLKSVHIDEIARLSEWIRNLGDATFTLRTWADFLQDGTTNPTLISAGNVSRHLQYPVNLFFGAVLEMTPGSSIAREVGLAELRRLVGGAPHAEAVPLIRQHALHLLGRYGDAADRETVTHMVNSGTQSADALDRKLAYCGLIMSSSGVEAAEEFVYHLARDEVLAGVDLAFDATHYRDLTLDQDGTLQKPRAALVGLATNIAKHYENPGRYGQLADADAFRMLRVIEIGGMASLGPEVPQMFATCLSQNLIPKSAGPFTRLLRRRLSDELGGLRGAAPAVVTLDEVPAPAPGAFLAYCSGDFSAVRAVAKELRNAGVSYWLDREHLLPGQVVQDVLEDSLTKCRATVVFIGADGLGPWEKFEYRHAITMWNESAKVVVPVVLAGTEMPARVPAFLKQFSAVFVEREGSLARAAYKIRAGLMSNVDLAA